MSLIVGIDLGTGGATVSTIKKGSIEVILNEGSKRISPALVSFHNGRRYMGEPAAGLESSNAKNTVREMKRFVGKQWSDPEVQRDIARLANRDRYRQLPNDQIGVEVSNAGEDVVLDVRAVLGMQLGGLKRMAETSLKEVHDTIAVVRDVVISVPPYYTDSQRRAVLDAARIADLNVLRLMNDSTAVALDFGMWKNARNVFDDKPVNYMFIDVGFADTWCSITSFTKGKATTLSCTWDRELGGRNVDSAVMEQFANEFLAKTKMDPRKDFKAMLKLRGAAEKAKQVLTPEGMTKAEVSVEYLMNETDLRTMFTIEQLDEIMKPLLDRFTLVIQRALADAGIKASDLAGVEMIGGSSRMRHFKKAAANALGLDSSKAPNYGVLTTLNAEETVSRGCALQCAILSPQFKIASTLEVKEFVPLPIKVQWEQPAPSAAAPTANDKAEDGEDQVATGNSLGLLKRTDDTPKVRRVTFRRSEPFEVVASYEDPLDEMLLAPQASRTIGKFKISGMPAGANNGKIAVNFSHDKSGVFGVSSAQMQTEEAEAGDEKKKDKKDAKKKVVKTDLQVQSVTGSLSDADLDQMIRAELEFLAKDKALKDLSDKRNELEEFIYSAKSDISDKLKQFATEEEASKLRTKLEEDEEWLYTEEGDAATFQQLSSRLAALQSPYLTINNRLMEIEARQQSTDKLSLLVQSYLSIANSVSAEYAHLADEDRKKVRAACDEALNWHTAQMEAQGKIPLNKDPIFTAAAIDERASKLRQECKPIVEKPKPKPAAEPKPAENGEKKAEKAPEEDKNKMDVEGEGEKKADEDKPKDDGKMEVEEL